MKNTILSLLFFLLGKNYSVRQNYQICTIAFYNLENLFDTEDDPHTFDNDFTPDGKYHWTTEKLNTKLERLANVIANIGIEKTKQAPAIIGFCEVENRTVLEQLIQQKALQNYDYGIVHHDSPDQRGIDVAALYNRKLFKLKNSQKHHLLLYSDEGKRIFTRDQLCFSGYLGSELIYFIVNHWPSRRGGTKISNPKRIKASLLTQKIQDSIRLLTPNANVVIMGDFNDNPNNRSLKNLKTKKTVKDCMEDELYNPMENLFKKGQGTLAHRDSWSTFDQILFSKSLLDSTGFQEYKTQIFKPKYLLQAKGKYKGYPKRCAGSMEGYSDHFPVYSYLIKRIE